MRLPVGNTITLPATNQEWLVADSTSPPVPLDLEGLKQYLPGWAREGDLAVRDAVLKALGRMVLLAWAQLSRTLNAQRSPRHAAGPMLAEHALQRRMPRAPGETEAEHRRRLMSSFSKLTPEAIKGACDEIVAEYAPTKRSVFIEPSTDFVFLAPASSAPGAPMCYLQPKRGPRLWASGEKTSQRTAGAYLFSVAATQRLEFWVGLHADAGSTFKGAFLGSVATSLAYLGSVAAPQCFLMPSRSSLASRVMRAVSARKGGGVVAKVFIDPALYLSKTP